MTDRRVCLTRTFASIQMAMISVGCFVLILASAPIALAQAGTISTIPSAAASDANATKVETFVIDHAEHPSSN
jgi:hypothetical protein